MTDTPAPPAIPTPPPPEPRIPRAYRKAPPEAWAAIREAYVAGTPAPELAALHGVTAWAIRKRASTGGWTRREHARRTLALDLPKLGGDRRPPEVAEAKARADAEAAEALAAARGRALAAEAEAAREEADPLEAARTLLRRAAGAAVAGRLAQAGAAVKLAEGLARAASALGLGFGQEDGDDGDADGEEPWEREPPLSPEGLEALREDVKRRYAKFDRPRVGAPVVTETPAPAVEAPSAAVDPAPPAETPPAGPAVADLRVVLRARTEADRPRGISTPYRSISQAASARWEGPSEVCDPRLRWM